MRSRYNLWARFGNTDPRFAALLNSLGDLQEKAKYRRSQFALTSSEAAEYLETLHEMRRHVDRRPRRTVALCGRVRATHDRALKGNSESRRPSQLSVLGPIPGIESPSNERRASSWSGWISVQPGDDEATSFATRSARDAPKPRGLGRDQP